MKIAIIGYYGHNNLGDELNLYEMIKLLQLQYPDSDITVFSGGLDCLYYQVPYKLILADTMTLSEYRNTLNSFDLIIIGGGGLVFLGANYFDFLQEGIKAPYIFSRVGIDDRIVSQPVCAQIKDILTKASDVSVRTSSDQLLAQKYFGMNCSAVPEAVWNYKAEETSLIHPGKKILVSVNAYSSEFKYLIKTALTNLKIQNTVYTLSMQDASNDFYYNILSTPDKRLILPESVDLHRKASFLASMDLVITSRLHAGLIAMSHGIPVLMLNSTSKVNFLLKELKLEYLFCNSSIDEELIQNTLFDCQRLNKYLLEASANMKKRASANIIPK